MVKIHAKTMEGNIELSIKGHAGYAQHGQDIVCASVSAIMQTALLGLEVLSQMHPDYVQFIEGENNEE